MKKILVTGPLTCFLAGLSFSAIADGNAPDTIFYGGDIVTMDAKRPSAEAVAVKNGTIQKVGKLADLKKRADSHTQLINLQGQTLLPGFVEPHVHIFGTTFSEGIFLDLSNFELPHDTMDGLVQKLTDYADKLPDGAWVAGFGVDPSRTDPFMAELTADILDKVSTTKPIFVINQSMHIAYVNHKALEVAGITDSTPNPSGGGKYVKDANGHLTGKLIEPPTYNAFLSKMPLPTKDEILTALKKTGRKLTQQGVTTSAEITLGAYLGLDKEYAILNELTHDGTLPVRVRAYIYADDYPSTNHTYKPDQGDDLFKVIGVKVISDGSNQGLTGAMEKPYSYPAQTTNTGNLNYTQQELLAIIKPRFDEGWQISIHANGDRAIGETLAVYEKLVTRPADAKKRLRIEHFSVPTEDEIRKARKLGVVPGFTIGHTDYWGEAFHDHILGAERADRIDPSAAMIEQGMRFAYHSDSPVSPINPLKYVSEGATRLWQVPPQKVLNASQKVSVENALKAVTIHAAYQMKMDDKAGSITPGKYADFAIVDRNPLKTEPYEIRNIKVKQTWLGGKLVNQNP